MIRCLIRKEKVKATPEELVRQRVLMLLEKLDYPSGLIAVEKNLHQLPHLQGIEVPLRRADILCYVKDKNSDYSLYPLLIIECKAAKLTQAALRQLVGYNHYIKSYFVALASCEEIRFGWLDGTEYRFISGFPKYQELLHIFS